MTLWRLSLHTELDGQGGRLASGRWHTQGRAVIYTATSPAGALLEVLVNLDVEPGELPNGYRLLGVELDDTLATRRVDRDDLPTDWQRRRAVTRTIGDHWLTHGTEAALVVPSAIIRHTDNVLLAPGRIARQPGIRCAYDEAYVFDPRLFAGESSP